MGRTVFNKQRIHFLSLTQKVFSSLLGLVLGVLCSNPVANERMSVSLIRMFPKKDSAESFAEDIRVSISRTLAKETKDADAAMKSKVSIDSDTIQKIDPPKRKPKLEAIISNIKKKKLPLCIQNDPMPIQKLSLCAREDLLPRQKQTRSVCTEGRNYTGLDEEMAQYIIENLINQKMQSIYTEKDIERAFFSGKVRDPFFFHLFCNLILHLKMKTTTDTISPNNLYIDCNGPPFGATTAIVLNCLISGKVKSKHVILMSSLDVLEQRCTTLEISILGWLLHYIGIESISMHEPTVVQRFSVFDKYRKVLDCLTKKRVSGGISLKGISIYFSQSSYLEIIPKPKPYLDIVSLNLVLQGALSSSTIQCVFDIFPNVEHLEIIPHMRNMDFPHLFLEMVVNSFLHLTSLDIISLPIDSMSISALAKSQIKIKKLHIHVPLGSFVYLKELLSSLPGLEELEITLVEFNELYSLLGTPMLPCLRKLVINGNPLPAILIDVLFPRLLSIQCLSFSAIDLDLSVSNHIRHMRNLHSICIKGNYTKAFLAKLFKDPFPTSLKLCSLSRLDSISPDAFKKHMWVKAYAQIRNCAVHLQN
ncbi:hypothetical protein NECID01_1849 [Nematocida sp. AWRm77]|nr:hypothetical protein NECID01_1849 [Nematocida sp. AWRm77]